MAAGASDPEAGAAAPDGGVAALLRRLARASATYGVSGMAKRAISLALIPIYTRFLTTGDFGIIGVLEAIRSVASLTLGMGLRGAVTRQYYDHSENPREVRQYMGTVVGFFLAVGVSIVLVLQFAGEGLFRALLANVPFHPFVPLTLWTAFFLASVTILLGLYRAREQAARYVTLELVSFLLALTLILYFVVGLRGGALGLIKGSFWASGVMFVVFLVLVRREVDVSFSPRKLREALAFSLPLLPHLLGAWVLSAADRILLERMVPLSEVGLYTLGYKIGMVVSLAVTAINSAWTPIFYDLAKNSEDAPRMIGRMFTIYLVAIPLFGLGVALFSEEITRLIAAESYHEAYRVVPAVAMGYVFQGLYFMSVTPIFYMKKTHIIPLLTLVSGAANLGLNILLIPHFGMVGAAYATLASFFLLFAGSIVMAQRLYRIPYEYGKIAGMGLLVAAGYGANEWLTPLDGWASVGAKSLVLVFVVIGLVAFRIVRYAELNRMLRLMIPGSGR